MKTLRGNLMLLLTAMIWGAAFVSQRVGMDYVGPFTFLCSRSVLGGVILLPLIPVFGRSAVPEGTGGKTLVLGGVLCGSALFLASALQQIGIQYTSVGKAGFLTAMYIVMTGNYSIEDMRSLTIECMEWILIQKEVPATQPESCGNYLLHDLPMCIWECRRYLDRLQNDFHSEYNKIKVTLDNGRIFADA